MLSRTRSTLAEALQEGPIRKDASRTQTNKASSDFARVMQEEVAAEKSASSQTQTSKATPAATAASTPVAAADSTSQAETSSTSVVLGPFNPAFNSPAVETSPAAVSSQAQTGQTTSSGAPEIVLNTGLEGAEQNPYFGIFKEGAVTGYTKWFQAEDGAITARGSTMYRGLAATAEGAEEALRLVQQYEPAATMRKVYLPGQEGQAGDPCAYLIDLPSGRNLNAGLVLEMYYQQGWGVDQQSEAKLRNEVLLGQVQQA